VLSDYAVPLNPSFPYGLSLPTALFSGTLKTSTVGEVLQ
jgi:hypothetical protein